MARDQPDLVIAPEAPNRRALILPGGGMRVAYQAGAVKALYDSGLRFSFADGASGGTMNLAALLSGITPDDLCRRWRGLNPVSFVSPRPLRAYFGFPVIGAFGDFDGIQHKVFPQLGIEIDKVRAARSVRATFNVCDFDDKIVVPVPHGELSLDLLLAGISLPLVTPAVRYNGRTYTDAVWIRDCNLIAAVHAGANELWVIWCIGNTPEYKDGLLEQYVHMIEMSALGALHTELAEIAAINAQIARGERPHGHISRSSFISSSPPTRSRLIPTSCRHHASRWSPAGIETPANILRRSARRVALTPLSTKMQHRAAASHSANMTGRVTFVNRPAAGYNNPAAYPSRSRLQSISYIDRFIADPSHTGELTGHSSAAYRF